MTDVSPQSGKQSARPRGTSGHSWAESYAQLEQTLRESLAEAQSDAEDWERVLAFLNRKHRRDLVRIQNLESQISDLVEIRTLGKPGFPDSLLARPESGQPFKGLTFVEAAERVLEEADGPLHVSELWSRMAEGGISSKAARPLNSLVAILYRDGRFQRVGKNVFDLREEPVDEQSTIPHSMD